MSNESAHMPRAQKENSKSKRTYCARRGIFVLLGYCLFSSDFIGGKSGSVGSLCKFQLNHIYSLTADKTPTNNPESEDRSPKVDVSTPKSYCSSAPVLHIPGQGHTRGSFCFLEDPDHSLLNPNTRLIFLPASVIPSRRIASERTIWTPSRAYPNCSKNVNPLRADPSTWARKTGTRGIEPIVSAPHL